MIAVCNGAYSETGTSRREESRRPPTAASDRFDDDPPTCRMMMMFSTFSCTAGCLGCATKSTNPNREPRGKCAERRQLGKEDIDGDDRCLVDFEFAVVSDGSVTVSVVSLVCEEGSRNTSPSRHLHGPVSPEERRIRVHSAWSPPSCSTPCAGLTPLPRCRDSDAVEKGRLTAGMMPRSSLAAR